MGQTKHSNAEPHPSPGFHKHENVLYVLILVTRKFISATHNINMTSWGGRMTQWQSKWPLSIL